MMKHDRTRAPSPQPERHRGPSGRGLAKKQPSRLGLQFWCPVFALLASVVLFTYLDYQSYNGTRFVNFKNAVRSLDPSGHKERAVRLPNFLLAGVQKSGSTALARYFLSLRDVCGPKGKGYYMKEAHYMDTNKMAKGASGYADLFAHCHESARVLMDATPNYQQSPENVWKIYTNASASTEDDLKNLKILFTLREPVSRDISRYKHILNERSHDLQRANGTGLKTFEEHMNESITPHLDEIESYRHVAGFYGMYVYWIKLWIHAGFRREQIMVASYDDMVRNEHDFLERLHDFLELPPPSKRARLRALNKQNGASTNPLLQIPCDIQERLAAVYDSPNQELYAWLDSNPGPPMERRPFTKFKFNCKQ